MPKSTSPVNGGALSKIDRSTVMRRAWAIFREKYKYPQIRFADIGRNCFGWALRRAWAEAREGVRVAAMSAEARAERIGTLQTLLERASYIDSGPQWKAAVVAYRTEIRQLQAA